jgi:glycine dehydrogenase subunit 1
VGHPYIPNSDPEIRRRMLAAVGADSVEEFYADIPDAIRLHRPLNLPAALRSEAELVRHMDRLLSRNKPAELSFLGAGCYQHHVPAVVEEIGNRSEFLTAYAGEPYEDHGRFQALWEYQSLMGELLELDVVNVPTYDGFQAAGTALRMAGRVTGRRRLLVVGPVDPDKVSKIVDFVRPDHDVEVLDGTDDGWQAADLVVGADVAAVYIEAPNYHGVLDAALPSLAERAHAVGALLVVGCNPISLGAVASPASYGADIVCGDIQPLGIRMSFGGGNAGFIATRDEERLVREFPSRLFGVVPTVVEGEYGFGDVFYDRTSFALREEGKEWVGTAAALNGIMAGVYLALMGPQGMREIGETILALTAYAQQRLGAVPFVSAPNAGLVSFADFVVRFTGSRTASEINALLLERGIQGGKVLSDTDALFCVTEIHAREDIDRLAAVLEEIAK